MPTENLLAVARQFAPQSRILDVREFGSGNLNDTYLATLKGADPIVLQRIKRGSRAKGRNG